MRDAVGQQVPLVRPENAPSADVFGHIQNRPSAHANAGCHLDSRTAYDLRSCLYGPASDERAAARDDAAGELTPVVGAGVGTKGANDAFGGSISAADQRAGGFPGIPYRDPGHGRLTPGVAFRSLAGPAPSEGGRDRIPAINTAQTRAANVVTSSYSGGRP
jgi:hypothetical protein